MSTSVRVLGACARRPRRAPATPGSPGRLSHMSPPETAHSHVPSRPHNSTEEVLPARNTSASSMSSASQSGRVSILSPVLARLCVAQVNVVVDGSVDARPGISYRQDQPGIGYQAGIRRRFGCKSSGYVVASVGCSGGSVTGFLVQNHYLRFKGAPHSSGGLSHAPFGGLGFRYSATSTGPRFGNLSRTNAAKPATVGRCLASTLKRALTCGRIRAVDSYYIRFDSSICGWPRLLYSCFCSGTRTEENAPRP